MDTNNQLPQMSMAGYLPNGMKVFFTVPIALDQIEYAYEIALKMSNTLFEKGLTLTEPGLEAGESKELIKVVMRREKPSDGTPIIDMYPEWGTGGDEPYGTYKYVHTYLNTPEQITEFLQAAGLKSLEQIPLYDGQAPLKRSQGRKHAKEFPVPTPFFAVRKQGDEKTGSDGQPYRPWMLIRLESTTPQNTPNQAQLDAPAQPKGKQATTAQKTPQIGEKRTFEIVRIETELTKDGKPYYNLIATDNTVINTFSRDIFRTWGYTDDVTAIWQKAGHTQDVEIPMPVEAKLVERKDKKGTVWAAIIPEVEF